jgi:hypothetical protein
MQDRLDRTIDGSGHATLVLSALPDDLVTCRDVFVRPELSDDFRGSQFVSGIGVGMQKVDDDGLGAQCNQFLRGIAEFVLAKRIYDRARRIHPLRDFETEVAGNDGLERSNQTVRVRPCSSAEFENVAEASGRDETAFRELALQHGIRRRGRAVNEKIDALRTLSGLFERRDHPVSLVGGRGRHLCQVQSSVGGVMQN